MTAQPEPRSGLVGHPLICMAIFATLYSVLLLATDAWQLADGTTLLRPSYGLTVAAMLLLTRRCVPVVLIVSGLLGAAYASMNDLDSGRLLLLAVGDPLGALLTALLAALLTRGSIEIDRHRAMAALCAVLLLAPGLQAMVASTVGPVTETWASASLAALLIVPFAASWARPAPAASQEGSRRGLAEAVVAVALPAVSVYALGTATLPLGVTLPGVLLVFLILLWGGVRRSPRITTAALLTSGAIAAWHLAERGRQLQGLADLDRAIVIALPVAATAVLLVSAVLLELARQRQFARRAVGLVATANEQLDSRSTLPLEARINRILREAAEYLDASDTALYVRAANSSLFRRSYRHARDQASLPDAMLSKQLRSLGGHDASVGTIVREQQQGTPKTLSSTNRIVAVRRPGADGGEVVLAAEWQLTDAAAPDAAAALLRLLLPACSAALSESRAVADRQLAQDRFRLVMQGVPDAVCLILPDGTVLAANPAFETLTGNEREAWRGRRLGELELFDAETLDGALAAATVGGPVHRTTVLRKESGETTSCDIHVLQLVGGEDPQVLLVARESTAETDRQLQQQNLERQFSQAQRMEAIGQLTQGVAHDFNNILGSIMGYTSLARMQGPVREDEKLSGYLSEIETAGKRATLLIQQMLTFSRRGRSNPESVSVSEVLGRVADLMPSLLPDGIIARTEISQNLPRLVVDVAQFEQAVISLAVNARDALGSRGTITLGARRFSAAVATCSSCRKPIGGDGVAIFVADTGTGIAPEVMDRLFEPFFTTKEVGRGTGLGLSGVHGFVHNNEGHVLVTSEPGIGSEFCLVLPAEVETARAPASPGKLPAPTAERKPHVLLVDDQQSLASLMKQVLETRNFRVTAETDGIAARDLFTSAPESFDAVVTDRFMPGLDGLALARHVRAARPGIPVVLCTGVNASHSDADIADAGICRVFRKPLRVMEFAQELEAMLLTAEPEAQES